MPIPAPHFLLFSEAHSETTTDQSSGYWHFVLESVDGTAKIEAADEEQEVDAGRLELLAVVRGLEALNQPSHVTLVTRSRSVSRGLRFGLERWKENDWKWECFGKMTSVKNSDLWQRVDHAMQYHDVRCRPWRFDPPEETVPTPKFVSHRRPKRQENRLVSLAQRMNKCFQGLRPNSESRNGANS